MYFLRRDRGGASDGESVGAGADGGKGDRSDAVFRREAEAVLIAAAQLFVLATSTVPPDGAHGMNDMAGLETVTGGDLRFAALLVESRPGRRVNGSIDAAASQQ